MPKVMLLILLICTTGMLCCVTRTVDIDGTGQYTSIQLAINASANGDIVLVYPGRYLENVVITTSGITLQSLEASTNNQAYIDSTIIDGNSANMCFKIMANSQNIWIQGFSITNGYNFGNGGGLLYFPNSSGTLKNCHVYNNTAVGGGGIMLYEANLHLSGVKIFANKCINAGGGIYTIHSATTVTFDPINRCSIYNNRAGAGQDIFISDAGEDIDVYLDTFTVLNPSNYFAEYYNGWQMNYHMNFHIQNAYFQETNHDLYVSPEGNDANDGLTPQTAMKTIHTAIYRTAQDSLNPKAVHVLPGTYSVTANQQMFPITMKSWVNLVGSGMDNTILLGEHDPLFPDMDVTIINSYNQRQYTFSDFNLNYDIQTKGYMIMGMDENNLLLQNLRIANLNVTNAYLLFFNTIKNSIIEGLVIDNISINIGSLIRMGGFSGIMRNCSFTNCLSLEFDPEVWVYPLVWMTNQSEMTIENCLFDNLRMSDDDSNCIDIGGIGNPPASLIWNIINCQFTNLVGTYSVIAMGSSNNPEFNITNSTFADCSGSNYTFTFNGTINIINSIFHNVTPYEVYVWPMTNGEHSNLTIDYSAFQNGQAGIYNPGTGNQINYLSNNTTADPRFLGGEETNPLRYSLALGSPCINTGTPDTTGLFLPLADLAGNFRIWNNRIDMGCYEYGSIPVGIEEEIISPEVGGTLSNFPNPFNPSTTISYNVKESSQVKLHIYNIKGQLVKTLQDGFVEKGSHSVVWNGKDNDSRNCASGVYFTRLSVDGDVLVRKMVLMK